MGRFALFKSNTSALRSATRAWVKNSLFVRTKRLTSSYEMQRHLKMTPAARLNIGAGGNRIPGWLNLDLFPSPGVVYMDAAQKWPFDDGSIDAVLCEHMIEHVPKALGVHLLREMRRVLKPGRWARVITPDLNWLATRILHPSSREDDEYLRFINSFMKRQVTTWCDAVNLCFYEHGHRYIWSIEELKTQLTDAGFADLTVTRAAYPEQTIFANTEGHPRLVGKDNDAIEAFAVEARAP